MKFQDIAIGTAFEFEGIEYVKTDALLATSSTGQRRLIRRSAMLKPVSGHASQGNSTARESDKLDRQRVLDAFEAFYAECIAASDDHQRLSMARQQFLKSI